MHREANDDMLLPYSQLEKMMARAYLMRDLNLDIRRASSLLLQSLEHVERVRDRARHLGRPDYPVTNVFGVCSRAQGRISFSESRPEYREAQQASQCRT